MIGEPPAGAASIRRATSADAEGCHQLLWEAVTDLGRRQATPLQGTVEEWWASSEPLHRFLAEHAAEWWVAKDNAAGQGQLIGYARSIERGGLFELTEFFVKPGQQSRGVGRALLERAFPAGRGEVRSIIATTDVRALARYYASDVVARFPFLTMAREPTEDEPGEPDGPAPRRIGVDDAAAVRDLERAVLGYARGEEEVRWLLDQREGYLYERHGTPVGFAFVSRAGSGPIAALEPADQPAMLLHVEGRAKAIGVQKLELEVPALNAVAVRHLLSRGFQIDPWLNLLMSNKPFGQFDRFIAFDPPIFL